MELKPQYDNCKSFYKKAMVEQDAEGTHLLSYEKKVCSVLDDVAIVYSVDSGTTLRHIKEFLKQNSFKALNKGQIIRDYMK